MFERVPKLPVLCVVCATALIVLVTVVVQAVRPDPSPGLRAGTWTVVGQAEAVPSENASQSGDARLGELISFEIESPEQSSPAVNLSLTYRDGTVVTTVASSEMQVGYLQATLVSASGARAFISFKQKEISSPVEASDGNVVVRFIQ